VLDVVAIASDLNVANPYDRKWNMRRPPVEGKHMFNKRLTEEADHSARWCSGPGLALPQQKKSRDMSGSQELTGRRQTEWLQPPGKNPDHWTP
jgi:hypothetical protein